MRPLPAGAQLVNVQVTYDATRYGLRSPASVCRVFGHAPLVMRAHPDTAAQFGIPVDAVIGRWCPVDDTWL